MARKVVHEWSRRTGLAWDAGDMLLSKCGLKTAPNGTVQEEPVTCRSCLVGRLAKATKTDG